MSKYTTELRWWCETATSKTGEDAITAAAPLLFNFSFPFYDAAQLTDFETKIIRHFWTREIGSETFGLFQLRLHDTIVTLAPQFNKMYVAAATSFNFLNTDDSTEAESNNATGTATASGNSSGTSLTTHSDTPQGSLANFEDNKYLTDAQRNTASNDTGSSSNSTATSATNRSRTGRAGQSPARLLQDYYDSIFNVDAWVMEQLDPLFMQIW